MKDITVIAAINKQGKFDASPLQKAEIAAFGAVNANRVVELRMTALEGRTAAQRGYYFGVVIPWIRREFLHRGIEATDADANEYLKRKFNGFDLVDTQTGEFYDRVGRSFERLPVEDFAQAIERISAWCASEFGHTFPPPITINPPHND